MCFVCKFVGVVGILFDEVFSDIKLVGFSDVEVIEIGLVILVIIFINIFNWVNDIVVDFFVIL